MYVRTVSHPAPYVHVGAGAEGGRAYSFRPSIAPSPHSIPERKKEKPICNRGRGRGAQSSLSKVGGLGWGHVAADAPYPRSSHTIEARFFDTKIGTCSMCIWASSMHNLFFFLPFVRSCSLFDVNSVWSPSAPVPWRYVALIPCRWLLEQILYYCFQ